MLLLVGGVAIGYYAWRMTKDNASLQRQHSILLSRIKYVEGEKSLAERSVRDAQEQLSKMWAELSTTAKFVTVGLSWDAECIYDRCPVKGTFTVQARGRLSPNP
jgi:hypothetical protein